ncbi:MAG: DUF86 domain-containing protein [Methanomicrobiaceae archaeon]|nr:DUF86 domain-containing protein [Methanomicrobiaceae archaeon]
MRDGRANALLICNRRLQQHRCSGHRGILDSELGRGLKEAHGLRNRLMHGYDGADDALACTALQRLTGVLREFSRVIGRWILL